MTGVVGDAEVGGTAAAGSDWAVAGDATSGRPPVLDTHPETINTVTRPDRMLAAGRRPLS